MGGDNLCCLRQLMRDPPTRDGYYGYHEEDGADICWTICQERDNDRDGRHGGAVMFFLFLSKDLLFAAGSELGTSFFLAGTAVKRSILKDNEVSTVVEFFCTFLLFLPKGSYKLAMFPYAF